jgi:hypothetical protein
MGLEEAKVEETAMGRDLLNTHRNFVVLGDGTFLSTKDNESEREHALKGLALAEEIVRSDYFKSSEFEVPPLAAVPAAPATGVKPSASGKRIEVLSR